MAPIPYRAVHLRMTTEMVHIVEFISRKPSIDSLNKGGSIFGGVSGREEVTLHIVFPGRRNFENGPAWLRRVPKKSVAWRYCIGRTLNAFVGAYAVTICAKLQSSAEVSPPFSQYALSSRLLRMGHLHII